MRLGHWKDVDLRGTGKEAAAETSLDGRGGIGAGACTRIGEDMWSQLVVHSMTVAPAEAAAFDGPEAASLLRWYASGDPGGEGELSRAATARP